MPSKKQAQPVPRTMRTRGMGSSPGGFRSLDSNAPAAGTRRGRAPSQETQKPPNPSQGTRRTRKDPSLKPKVTVGAGDADVETTASITQTTSPEDAVVPALQPSSRSQSPHLETESDSFPQMPESRSTTPPARHTRSQTRSMSPNATEQQHKHKQATRKTAPAIRSGYAGSGNVFSGLAKKKKRTRNDISASIDEDINASNDGSTEEPSAKRTRRDEPRSFMDQSTPAFMEPPAAVAEDSSADDVDAEVERPPRSSRNHSRSSSRQPLPNTDVNAEDASAEDSSSDTRKADESRSSVINPIRMSGKPLTPKPTSWVSKSTTYDPISDDLEERDQIYYDLFKRHMPVPQYQRGHPKFGHAHYRDEDNSGNEDEDEMSFIADGPSPTRGTLTRRKSALLPVNDPGSLRDIIKERKKEIEAAKAQKNKGATTKVFKFHRVVIPAGFSSGEIVLTGRQLIETTRSLCNYAERNPTARLPTASEMERLLIEFGARESASQHDEQLVPNRESSQHQQQRLDLESDTETYTMSNTQDTEGADLQQAPSEVQAETPKPHTATPQRPDAQQSRGWFTGVSSLLATPMRLFGRRSQPAEAATTNGAAVTDASSNDHLIPQTSDFAVPPTTPTIARNRRTAANDTRTRRQIAPQTERRPRVLAQQPKISAQTERRVHFYDPSTLPPLHMRGILSEERKRAIWQEQDEAQLSRKIDRNREYRHESRVTEQVRVEDEDEHDANLHIESAHPGKKRKTRHPQRPVINHPNFEPDNWNWEGTFRVPDSPSSSEDGDSQLENGVDANPDASSNGDRRPGDIPPMENAPTDNPFGRSARVNQGIDSTPSPRPQQPTRVLHPNEAAIQEKIFGKPHVDKETDDTPDTLSRGDGKLFGSNIQNSGYGTSIRQNRYTGTLFAQPPDVQANLEEGKYALAPRNPIGPTGLPQKTSLFHRRRLAESNIFAQLTPTEENLATGQAAPQAVEATSEVSTAKETNYTPTPSRTFSADYEDDESDENEAGAEKENSKGLEVQNTPENVAEDASVLQPKTWTQTPPPKPKPSNAQLPQVPTQPTAADGAKARYEKFKPARPSGLRNVTQMSPLHLESNSAQGFASYPLNDDLSSYGISSEVLAALWAIPDDAMIETTLPAFVYDDGNVRFNSEVENEILNLVQ